MELEAPPERARRSMTLLAFLAAKVGIHDSVRCIFREVAVGLLVRSVWKHETRLPLVTRYSRSVALTRPFCSGWVA